VIRSMTGFGSARRAATDIEILVDLRSVNNRFFDFQARLPRELSFLEGDILERCKARGLRGRVNVQVALERAAGAARPRLDGEALAAYLEAADRLRTEHGFTERGSAAAFLALPELFGAPASEPDRELLARLAGEALEEALDGLAAMKLREGAALAEELQGRVGVLQAALTRIEAGLPEARVALRAGLEARIAELLGEVPVDPQRLAQELAFLIDRSDLTEETVRLASHLEQFGAALADGGEVAKKLGFLLQEILREANTIGSKAQALAIVQEVLLIKEETEKIREQIQNIE
jgi:uncharacterized protein (TIGR00255 family)